jgi:heptosyltransferase-2
MLTRAVPRPVPAVHQGRYYQRLVAAAGIPSGPLEPMLEPPADARVSAETLLRDRGWDGRAPLVVVAPGAAYGTAKQWPVPHVRTLVSGLVSEGRVCVLVGSRADAPTTAAVREGLDAGAGRQVIDTAGETSLPVLAALLSLAGVCVANDSGAMHLAGALGVPVVAVFGPTNEHETAPLTRRGRTATVLTAPVWCRPCMLRTCPLDHRCMQRVEPARVRDAVDHALTARVEPR